MKKFAIGLALVAIVAFVGELSAQRAGQGKGGGQRAAGAQGKKGGAQGQKKRGGQQGGQAGRRGEITPQVVARFIEEFDKDNDNKLNAQELSALLTSMRERRTAGGGRGAAGQRGGAKQGAGGRAGGGRKGGKNGNNGENAPLEGVTPKRPGG